jgi:hypothetical protein
MEMELFRIFGGVAGLAGLAVGVILLLYKDILSKKIFASLTKKDSYRLLRNVAVLAWSVAMCGIIAWAWSTNMLHRNGLDPAGPTDSKSADSLVVAGTVVDQVTNLGIGGVVIHVEGGVGDKYSEDNGNFRVVLPNRPTDRVVVTAQKPGYFEITESVLPPTHDLILPLRPR